MDMKKTVALMVLLTISVAAGAVEGGQVAYAGGTLSGVKPGTIGRLDTAQETSLVFEHPSGKIIIPFSRIESFTYSEERARRLGVLPTIAIGLFKRLQRRHFFRISYRDDANLPQAIVLEGPKQTPQTLEAILKARVPDRCKSMQHPRSGN